MSQLFDRLDFKRNVSNISYSQYRNQTGNEMERRWEPFNKPLFF
jgi:hypothetical protein